MAPGGQTSAMRPICVHTWSPMEHRGAGRSSHEPGPASEGLRPALPSKIISASISQKPVPIRPHFNGSLLSKARYLYSTNMFVSALNDASQLLLGAIADGSTAAVGAEPMSTIAATAKDLDSTTTTTTIAADIIPIAAKALVPTNQYSPRVRARDESVRPVATTLGRRHTGRGLGSRRPETTQTSGTNIGAGGIGS